MVCLMKVHKLYSLLSFPVFFIIFFSSWLYESLILFDFLNAFLFLLLLGSSYNPPKFDSTNLLANHLGVEYTSVYLSDNTNFSLEDVSSAKHTKDNTDSNSDKEENEEEDTVEEEEQEVVDPCPSGHLHVFIDGGASGSNISKNLEVLNARFRPNVIFIESQDIYPQMNKEVAHILPLAEVDYYAHKNFVNTLLHAAEVLLTVNVQAPQHLATMRARLLWLLCIFYARLRMHEPYPIVEDRVLAVAANYLRHMFYSFDNLHHIHGKFINQHLFNVVFEFLMGSHQGRYVVERIFKQVFQMDEYSMSDKCPLKLPHYIVPGTVSHDC